MIEYTYLGGKQSKIQAQVLNAIPMYRGMLEEYILKKIQDIVLEEWSIGCNNMVLKGCIDGIDFRQLGVTLATCYIVSTVCW